MARRNMIMCFFTMLSYYFSNGEKQECNKEKEREREREREREKERKRERYIYI